MFLIIIAAARSKRAVQQCRYETEARPQWRFTAQEPSLIFFGEFMNTLDVTGYGFA
ncbi:MAG: hypothetical protein WA459_03765 [Stellaceae bacterium]